MKLKRTYIALLSGLILAVGMLVHAQVQDDSLPDEAMAGDSLIYESTAEDTAVAQMEPTDALSQYAKRIVDRFKKSPLLISILYVVILYSIVTLVTLLIIILLNRRRLEREEVLKEYLLEKYQQLLMNYLFDEEKKESAYKELHYVANNRIKRQILIDQMIDLSVNLKGEIKQEIQYLFLRLGLKKDSLEKAHSRKWHENVKGFRELAYMNIRDANEQIIKSLNSSNEILRMEAQIAMVRLSDGNPYEFLHLLKKPLSLWEQVTLHELQIQHNLEVPEFKQWFDSENISVVIFAIEMVAWYKQVDAGHELIKLFEHENEQVRHTAYKVAGEIKLTEALPVLVKRYPEENMRNKLEILRTFARLPDEEYLQFLKSVLDTEEDVQLQIQATKAMENTDEPGISMLIKLMKSKSEYKNYQIIIRHVLDGRIY
jgi:HEAT repeat protein